MGGIVISSEDGLELLDECREPRWGVGLEQVVQLPCYLILGVLVGGLGDQGEELDLVALAVATGAAISEVGLNGPVPSCLCFVGITGGPLKVFQNCPSLPGFGCVAVRFLTLNRPLQLLACFVVSAKHKQCVSQVVSFPPLPDHVSGSHIDVSSLSKECRRVLHPTPIVVEVAQLAKSACLAWEIVL